jgi:histidinol-phosphate aminotransferase
MNLFRPDVAAIAPYPESQSVAPVKADFNEAPWDWPEALKAEAARILLSTPLNRYPAGEVKLAAALADRWELDPASVLVGNGSDEVLLAVFLAALGPGRKVLVPRPSYRLYSQMAGISAAAAVELPLDESLTYRPEAWLEAIRRERPNLVVICSPNNPSGACFPPGALDELLECAPGLVAIDEAYAEFAGSDSRRFLKEHANLLLVRTFSKAWGAAGLRLGYLLGRPAVTAQIRKVLLPFRVNEITARLGLLALRHKALIEARIPWIVTERERLFQGLKDLPSVAPYPSKANFILVRLRSRPARDVYEGLLARGINVRRFASEPMLEDCLRITVGTPRENDAVIEGLREVLS